MNFERHWLTLLVCTYFDPRGHPRQVNTYLIYLLQHRW